MSRMTSDGTMGCLADDLALLDAWLGGDRDAAGELLDRHIEGLSRFLRGKVTGDVDDHIQEVFTRCLARRQSLESGSSFRAYLFAVARNLVCEQFRTMARQPVDTALVSVADLSPNASAVLRRADDRRLLLDALSRIPIDSQLTLELYYWENLSVDEMARVFEVPAGTIKSRLHRARSQLRQQLETLGEGHPELSASLECLDEWNRSPIRDQ